MRPISVCALVPYPLGSTPSQRFRLEQWAPDLRQAGIELELVPFVDPALMRCLHQPGHYLAKAGLAARATARRLRLLRQLDDFDLVIVHRAALLAGPATLEHRIARRRPILFDFDDAIWLLHTTAANRHIGWLKSPGKTAAICRASAQVVVGNRYLAEYARQYNDRVDVVPSSIDTDLFLPALARRTNGPVVVGWTGSSTSQTYLEAFAPVLRELARTRSVEIRVHSDRRPDLPGVEMVWRPWSPDNELVELQAFDIGIMPMPDDRWARGKCAMKALLYMSVGVPAICEAVGTNREVIQHGENGLLAASPEEWLRHLHALIDDRAQRARLGAAGRATVEAGYSRRHCAALFADAVRRTVEGCRR